MLSQGKNPDNTCQNATYIEGEIIIPDKHNIFILERNESQTKNESRIDIGFDLFKPIFKITSRPEEQIQQVLYIDSKKGLWQKQFCRLIRFYRDYRNYYKITCSEGIRSYLIDNKFDFSFSEEYTLVLKTDNEDKCEYFFENNFGFTVICFADTYFKFLKINQKNETTVHLLYNHSQSTLNQCIRSIKQRQGNEIHIIYINCSSWLFYGIINKEVKILLDKNIFSQKYPELFDQTPHNTNDCQSIKHLIIILIFQDSYVQITLNNNITSIGKIPYMLDGEKLEQVSFRELSCTISNQYIMQQNPKELLIYFSDGQSVFIKDVTRIIEIYTFNSFFILRYEIGLKVIVNENLIWSYNRPIAQLFQLNNTRYYCVLTSNLEEVMIFENQLDKLSYLKNQIRLTPIEVFQFGVETKYQLWCQGTTILEKQRNDFLISIKPLVENQNVRFFDKQGSSVVYLMKNVISSSHPFSIDFEKYQIRSISDQLNLKDFCNLTQFYSHLFYIQLSLPYENVIIVSGNNQTTFYLCKSNKQITYRLKFTSIILNYNYIILVSNNKIMILEMLEELHLISILYFGQEINVAYCLQNNVFITLKNSTETHQILFSQKKITDIKQRFKEFGSSDVLFYFQNEEILFVQFFDKICVKKKDVFFEVTLRAVKIIYFKIKIQIDSHTKPKYIMFLGIPEKQNVIQKYYVINNELIEDINIPLFDYQLIMPPIYQSASNYLVIAVKKGQQYYALLYNLDNPMIYSLQEVIQISKLEFAIYQQKFTYFDIANKVVTINLLEFVIHQLADYNTNLEIINKVNIKLDIISILTPEQPGIVVSINFETINNCKALGVKANFSNQLLDLDEKAKFKIRDFIIGSVDHMKVLDETFATLDGPFLLQTKMNCLVYDNFICLYSIQDNKAKFLKTKYFVTNYNNPLIENIQIFISLNQQIIVSHIWPLFYEEGYFLLILSHNIMSQISVYELRSNGFVCNQDWNNYFYLSKPYKLQHRLINPLLFIFIENEAPLCFRVLNSQIQLFNDTMNILDATNIEANYVFVKKHSDVYNVILSFDIYEVNCQTITFVKQYILSSELFQNVIANATVAYYKPQIMSLSIISQEKLQSNFIIKAIILTNQEFSFIAEFELIDNNIQMIITHIIRQQGQSNFLFFFDYRFLILDFDNSESRLYDLRDNAKFIESVLLFQNQFHSIHFFNTTHYIFTLNNTNNYFGQIDFLVQLINFNKSNIDITLPFRAWNNLSALNFNVTFVLEREIQFDSKSLTYTCLIVVTIFIIISYLRRVRLLNKIRFVQ